MPRNSPRNNPAARFTLWFGLLGLDGANGSVMMYPGSTLISDSWVSFSIS